MNAVAVTLELAGPVLTGTGVVGTIVRRRWVSAIGLGVLTIGLVGTALVDWYGVALLGIVSTPLMNLTMPTLVKPVLLLGWTISVVAVALPDRSRRGPDAGS